MRQKYRERKRTVSGRIGMPEVVLFLLFPVLFVLFFLFPENKTEKMTVDEACLIVKESLAGCEEIPLEQYLIGAVAGAAPEMAELETYKALAVLFRTNVWYLAREKASARLPYEELGQRMLTGKEMYEKWGGDFERELEKLKEAVKDTRNQCLCYEGAKIELPYFSLCEGKTKDVDLAQAEGMAVASGEKGQGFAMSLYQANEMAKEGEDYRALLDYFFPACEIVKN